MTWRKAAMEARIDEVERRLQEMEVRTKLQLDEHAARMEQIVATALQRATPGTGNPRTRPEHNGNQNEGERRLRKIDLPVFNGEEATGWLTKIERFFKVRHIEEDEKLDAAMMAVEGEALSWLQGGEASAVVCGVVCDASPVGCSGGSLLFTKAMVGATEWSEIESKVEEEDG